MSKFFSKSIETFGKDTVSSWSNGQMAVGTDFFLNGKSWHDVKETTGDIAIQKLMWLVRDIFLGPNLKLKRFKPFYGVSDAQEVFNSWRSKSSLAKHLTSASQPKKKVSFKTNSKYAALSM